MKLNTEVTWEQQRAPFYQEYEQALSVSQSLVPTNPSDEYRDYLAERGLAYSTKYLQMLETQTNAVEQFREWKKEHQHDGFMTVGHKHAKSILQAVTMGSLIYGNPAFAVIWGIIHLVKVTGEYRDNLAVENLRREGIKKHH